MKALFIRGDLNGGPVFVVFASDVTISGVIIGAEVEIALNCPQTPIRLGIVQQKLPAV